MQAKIRKPFGIWADSKYIAKVDDNTKVYRKIRDMKRYYRKHHIRISLRRIIENLKDPKENPFWSKRMKKQSTESWRKHAYAR